MKILPLLFIPFILFSCNTGSYDERIEPIEKVKWLLGNWELISEDSIESGFEYWEEDPHGNLKGIGISMELGDTVFAEHLSIVRNGDLLFYVVDLPDANAPVLFQIQDFTENGFICRNDSNDFPKEIEYIQKEDSMHVIIRDSEKAFTFEFLGQAKD